MVCPARDDLSRGVADDRINQLRLRMLVELARCIRGWIVVLTHCTDAFQLAIDVGLVGPNVANDLPELCDPVAVLGLLEPRSVDHEALLGELDQDGRGPSPEHRRLGRRDAVTD